VAEPLVEAVDVRGGQRVRAAQATMPSALTTSCRRTSA